MGARHRVWLAAAAAVLAVTACGDGTPVVAPAPSTVTATVTQTQTQATTPTRAPRSASPTKPPTTGVPETAADWAAVVKRVGSSVVRLDVAACDARWMGSGFVVGKDLVMTAAHVVDGAVALSLQTPEGVVTGQVIDLDRPTDSALVRTSEDLATAPLALAGTTPGLGSGIAILGFPLEAYSLRVTQGLVSGLDEQVPYDTFTVEHAMVTDAAINGGNSGGPVVDKSGDVVGLVTGKRMWVTGADPAEGAAEGIGYVVPASSLRSNLESWRGQAPGKTAVCEGDEEAPVSDDGLLSIDVHSDAPDAADIARSLSLHGQSINQGNYDAAWEVFTPRMQDSLKSLESWKEGLGTSYWERIAVLDVASGADSAAVRVGLKTRQDAEYGYQGQTCSLWSLTYTMVSAQGGWLIDRAQNAKGSPKAC